MHTSPLARGWLDVQEWTLGRLQGLRTAPLAANLATGLAGEQAALFHLRRLGYTIVAQRWTSTRLRGDVDLIAWQGDWLCFIEVKARTARDLSPAETAVDADKQRILRGLARAYLKAFPEDKQRKVPVRFDVVAVYLLEHGTEFELFEGAFGWR